MTKNEGYDGSRIVFSMHAEMEDYLVKKDNSNVIEGVEGFRKVETVCALKLESGIWKVDNIEQADMVSQYLKMENKITEEVVAFISTIST